MLTDGQKQQVQALREQFVGLDTDEWTENKKKAQQRGLQFESLVQDLFEVHGLLLRRSYRTQDNQSEQIDGAAQFSRRHALLEQLKRDGTLKRYKVLFNPIVTETFDAMIVLDFSTYAATDSWLARCVRISSLIALRRPARTPRPRAISSASRPAPTAIAARS